MRVINEVSETVPIDTIRPHPRNPRQGDVGAIHESIEANGFYGVVVAQRSTGHILAGNHRWLAAQHAGATEVPVVWVDVDDDHALRILLSDNRTNDLAGYDTESLVELLQGIHASGGGLVGTGYDGDDLDELVKDLNAPTFRPSLTPTLDASPVGSGDVSAAGEKLGEMYQQERQLHEILCPKCGHEFFVD